MAPEFPLLRLPAELRNAIYELVATEAIIVDRNGGTHLPQTLAAVNRQIRHEYTFIIGPKQVRQTHNVRARVHNLGFTKLTLALNGLPPLESGSLRHLELTLVFDKVDQLNFRGRVDLSVLDEWLGWAHRDLPYHKSFATAVYEIEVDWSRCSVEEIKGIHEAVKIMHEKFGRRMVHDAINRSKIACAVGHLAGIEVGLGEAFRK